VNRVYYAYATTVFDYIRRAMPYDAPRSFSDSEVYALTAYILSLEGPTLPLPSPALMII
jgi:cytochrome c